MESAKKSLVMSDLYPEMLKDTETKTILVFSSEVYSSNNQLSMRVLADYGVPEDPTTGSAK